jgi:hypothetical protein
LIRSQRKQRTIGHFNTVLILVKESVLEVRAHLS